MMDAVILDLGSSETRAGFAGARWDVLSSARQTLEQAAGAATLRALPPGSCPSATVGGCALGVGTSGDARPPEAAAMAPRPAKAVARRWRK